jgi:predicted extracellular nuclease
MKQSMPKLFSIALILAMIVSFLPAQAQPAGAVSPNIVISQVYGGGGSSTGSPAYKTDYVELFNRGTTPVDINGWSLQYASATGVFGGSTGTNIVVISVSTVIPSGTYYMIQLGSTGTAGGNYPVTPDFSSTIINMSGTAGKIALAGNSTWLNCSPVSSCITAGKLIVDAVAYGNTSNGGEGDTSINNNVNVTTALGGVRKSSGCTDTDNNNADFDVVAPPIPRNSASPTHTCAASTNPTGIGAATPNSLFAGNATLLTVAVTPGANPVTTGHSVTCDLTTIGGSATQAFLDDGLNGDAVAGDSTFSFSTTVAGGTTGGAKGLTCTINDAENRPGNATINLTVTAATNPSGTGAANPNAVSAGGSTLLTAAVTPGANPTSTGLGVTCDLTAIGGLASQTFLDDGLNGDVTAGDNTFSFQAAVTGTTTTGAKNLSCSITDSQSRSGSASIAVNVLDYVPVPDDVVISQVYGGGGNSGATYKNDFIELYNRSTNTISLAGWSVQYASAAGTSWAVTNLSGSLAPGKYYLVQEAAGNGGTVNLPTPDASGNIAMSATAGKVALVNTATALSGTCPTGSNISDFVGFGPTANCSETSPTAILSNTTAAIRKAGGATDTNNNLADFTIAAPVPHNSSGNPFGYGAASLSTPFPGMSTLLTVVVIPGYLPPSSGLAVSCDLTPIGGSATQVLYDDGTHGDVTTSNNTFSYLATVANNTASGAKSLTCTITDAQTRSASTSIGLSVGIILPIGTVNGPVPVSSTCAVHEAAYKNQTVVIRGVIYEKTLQSISNSDNTYKGFFIQNTVATADTDLTTSDGLFVFMSTAATIGSYTPQVGDEIILSGSVSEYYNMTELVSPLNLVQVLRGGVIINNEILPAVANPPVSQADANCYWERLQGSRVKVPQGSIVLGGRNVFSPADAEIWLAHPDSTIGSRSGYEQRAFRDAHPLDDNYDAINWDGNGYRILMGSLGIKGAAGNAKTLIDPARTFSTLSNTPAGGLNYTFSKYRIEVSSQPTFDLGLDPAANHPAQVLDRNFHYTIVDYNLENLYDYRDNPNSGCDYPTDTIGCSQVAPFKSGVTPPYDYVPASDAVYQSRLNDIALQIINDLHSPDILMVQEVENQDICTVTGGALTCGTTDNADGKPDVLQELALKIAALPGGQTYDAAFDRDSSDLRGIAPAFLYRTDRVELLPAVGDPLLGATPTIDGYTNVPPVSDISNPKTFNAVYTGAGACETDWVFPRAPDVGLFRIYRTSIGVDNYQDVYVINNHFKSGPDTCVAHRTEQAKYNAALVDFIQTANPNARIVVGGDLNVYPRPDDIALNASDQLGSLYASSLGLKNLWEVLLDDAPEAAYSYVYLGQAQTLDQMFINQKMLDNLTQFRIAHINSDFPADYPAPGDVARGTSDHDPNVAAFLLKGLSSVSINNLPVSAAYGGSFTPTFTSVGDGTISVASLTTGTCTVSGGVVSYVAVGLCKLQASITEGDYYLAATGLEQSFNIAKATATVTFDLGNPAALQVSAPGGSLNAGLLTLKVYVASAAGNINNAGLTVTLTPLAGGASYTLVCSSTPASGTTKTFTCTNTGFSIPVGTYDVTATITGGYYTGEGYDGFTVYDPSLGFATGGGWFYWPGTTDKTTFGFVPRAACWWCVISRMARSRGLRATRCQAWHFRPRLRPSPVVLPPSAAKPLTWSGIPRPVVM